MKSIKIIHISDTHNYHNYISIPKDIKIDMVIHSGDAANNKDPNINSNELMDFLDWYEKFPATYKIFVPGNHETSMEKWLVNREDFEKRGIILLKHESIEIEGVNIFGSPYTPSFRDGWAYNIKRSKLYDYWQEIPENTDILVTHGPPMFILDQDLGKNLGCRSLYKRIKELSNLKIHQFGHIHDRRRSGEISINRGIYQDPSTNIRYINASCVDLDYRWLGGNIITEFTY